MKAVIVLAALTLALVACEQTYEDELADLVSFVAKNKLGNNNDMWIVKRNVFGELEKVALVFGFGDDADFCRQVIEDQMERYTATQYFCQPAN